MKKALMLFAEGFETVEALMVVDLLRRGGVEVSMASIDENEMVTSAQGIGVQMDMVMGEADLLTYDAVILPGGMPGTNYLKESGQDPGCNLCSAGRLWKIWTVRRKKSLLLPGS